MTGPNVKRALARRPSPPIDAKLQQDLDTDRRNERQLIIFVGIVYFVTGWFAGVLTVAFWRWAVP